MNIDLERFDSIQQGDSAGRTSGKYSFIPTTTVVNVLEKHGWEPVRASEVKCRDLERRGFQKHLIRFRNSKIIIKNKDQLRPEIVLTNAHDGLASFILQAGIFRVVCANGLIVADSVFAKHRICHMGYTDHKVSLAIEAMCDSVPKIGNKVEEFQAIDMTKDEQGVFAMAALAMKYGEEAVEERKFLTDALLYPSRSCDKEHTLWNTYNTIQEKFIKGGRFEVKEVKSGYYRGREKLGRSRGCNSINESIRINKGLWMLIERMAELKKAA